MDVEHDAVEAQSRALSQLRRAAAEYRATQSDAAFREVVRGLAAQAVARGLRAEDLIIAFKQLWTSVPDVLPRRETRPILDDLVSLCIEEYYRQRGTPPRGSQSIT